MIVFRDVLPQCVLVVIFSLASFHWTEVGHFTLLQLLLVFLHVYIHTTLGSKSRLTTLCKNSIAANTCAIPRFMFRPSYWNGTSKFFELNDILSYKSA